MFNLYVECGICLNGIDTLNKNLLKKKKSIKYCIEKLTREQELRLCLSLSLKDASHMTTKLQLRAGAATHKWLTVGEHLDCRFHFFLDMIVRSVCLYKCTKSCLGPP